MSFPNEKEQTYGSNWVALQLLHLPTPHPQEYPLLPLLIDAASLASTGGLPSSPVFWLNFAPALVR